MTRDERGREIKSKEFKIAQPTRENALRRRWHFDKPHSQPWHYLMLPEFCRLSCHALIYFMILRTQRTSVAAP